MTRHVIFGICSLAIAISGLSARATLIYSDAFDYPDGSLTSGSGIWFTHSGTAGQMQVEGGAARVTSSNSEDVSINLDQQYSTGTLYYSAVMTMTSIPGSSTYGAYLMHFSDTDTGIDTDFFARLFVNAVDANTFKFGVRTRSLNASPSDYDVAYSDALISLGETVAVIVKLDLNTLQSTLWVNPTDASSASVTDTFAVTFAGADQTLSRFSIRESSGIGSSLVDQVLVGTTFEDVFVAVPEPHVMGMLALGMGTILLIGRSRRKARFSDDIRA